jgi:hypothetical protein
MAAPARGLPPRTVNSRSLIALFEPHPLQQRKEAWVLPDDWVIAIARSHQRQRPGLVSLDGLGPPLNRAVVAAASTSNCKSMPPG